MYTKQLLHTYTSYKLTLFAYRHTSNQTTLMHTVITQLNNASCPWAYLMSNNTSCTQAYVMSNNTSCTPQVKQHFIPTGIPHVKQNFMHAGIPHVNNTSCTQAYLMLNNISFNKTKLLMKLQTKIINYNINIT